MNGPHQEIEKRNARRRELEATVDDFQRSEPVIVEAAENAVREAIALNFPIIKGCALQSGHMKGKLTLEISFDLTPGHKSVEVRGCVQPPPVTTITRKELKY
jgi:hypothetical protein